MSNQMKQMAVRLKPLLNDADSGCKWERSLDKIFSPGSYAVEIDHTGTNVGLPVNYCGEEHYIVGNLLVTDCGTVGPKQRDRVTGQVLTITTRDEKTTGVYVRTFANGVWREWKQLLESKMFDKIDTDEKLLATVNSLVTEYEKFAGDGEGSIKKSIDDALAVVNENIDTEKKRSQTAENELLTRLQGTSENSNAVNDPFKRLPKVSDVTELMTVLDAMHGSSANSAYNGRFRVFVGSQDVDIYNYVLGYQYDTWVQEIRCPYELCQTFTDKTINLPNGDYYLARKYKQELRMVSSIDYRGGTRTLRRMHNVDKWTNWVDTTNPYINSPLYGKNILLLGGSFAHNTRATGTSNSGYGFTLLGHEYSLQNYVAQELGLNRFDNYAMSGNGSCTSKFTYSTLAQLEAAITYADEQEYTYDGIVIFGGANDYMNNSPLGTIADPMGDDTFYASFKKIINRARTKYPTAKLYLATPFKGFSKPEFYNPTSTVTNDAGHRYYEYVQALKDIALYASIPLLDIYSIHQVDTNNYGRYTRSSADDVLHPNGLGYQNIALPLIEFLARG